MPVDLEFDPVVTDLADRTATFVRETVIPVEVADDGIASEDIRSYLQAAARKAGVFAPHVTPEYGGHGLDM
jgi:acyl-CoA dehydrogenase